VAALAGDPREEVDPVCGMTVVVEGARHRAEHDGRAYLFCNARCREKFLAAPARYLSPAAGAGSR
jgi:YHS domain-containing protein